MARLSEAVCRLIIHETSSPAQAASVVRQLPGALANCNELPFDSWGDVIAYTAWHLVDRYGRILQVVLDQLLVRGHLPLRKTRLSVLEIGAGPAPALHAVRDFYDDLSAWGQDVDQKIELASTTHLLSLDRGVAWSHLVHLVSEELLVLGNGAPNFFRISYPEFASFSGSCD